MAILYLNTTLIIAPIILFGALAGGIALSKKMKICSFNSFAVFTLSFLLFVYMLQNERDHDRLCILIIHSLLISFSFLSGFFGSPLAGKLARPELRTRSLITLGMLPILTLLVFDNIYNIKSGFYLCDALHQIALLFLIFLCININGFTNYPQAKGLDHEQQSQKAAR